MPKLFLEILLSLVDALKAMKLTSENKNGTQTQYQGEAWVGHNGKKEEERRLLRQTPQTPVLLKRKPDHAKQTHMKALLALVLGRDSRGQRLYVSNGQHCAGHRVNSHKGLMNE